VSGSILLSHGEQAAVESLRGALEADFPSVIAAQIGESYALLKGAAAKRLATGRTEIAAIVGRDWQNAYADFAANLKREIQRIEPAERRAEAIARMRAILDAYAGVSAGGG
jgi:metallo-beta-lactamase family protein